MLVGREPEQQQIARLVAAGRLGQSGVLVVRGEPGIGKTALLEDTADRAGDMRVMRASGSEPESGLAFSALHHLLRPALHLIDHIPAPQRDALEVALTLRRGPAPERFAVSAATLSLLSRYAEESPLLILVDDAHLLDPPSAETLAFVARRLLADPITMLIAMRSEHTSVLAESDLAAMELTGIDLSAATTLIGAASGAPVTTGLVASLHRATAGNPLALIELARDADHIDFLSPELPLPVPRAVAGAFARRVAELPEPSRCALLVTVIADGDLSVAAHAAATVGTGLHRLSDAEEIGLIRLHAGRAEFRHPLVRSAVYAAADPQQRRDAHRAVAAALPERADDRRAWHLSEATIGPDDGVALLVFEAGARARDRGAYGLATAAFARSAELTADHALRGNRLAAAGESAWLAGRPKRATELLTQAAELVTAAVASAEIDGLRGNVALRTASPRTAHELFVQAAIRVEPADPDVAAQLLADAVTASFYLCDAEAGLVAADRLAALLDDCDTAAARVRAQMAIGIAQVLAGRAGVEWIRKAVQALNTEPNLLDDPGRPDWTIIGTLFLRESAVGRELIRHVVARRRDRTALGALPNLLFHTGRDEATTDRWRSAVLSYDESIALARETQQSTDLAVSLAGLAWLQARMGLDDGCRDNAAEALTLAEMHDITLASVWAQFALGDAALAAGHTAEAIRRYRGLQEMLRDTGFRDVDVEPGPELAEAQLRHGDRTGAARTADEYHCRARDKNQPWALARAHRALAMTTSDPNERARLFDKALELHTLSPDMFEYARTRLAHGSALRRDKSRTAARAQLQHALEVFERLGARPWADLAANELYATGGRARRAGDGPLAALTPQESRIAQMLGAGNTTKQTAAALFLSPKTVEYHLRHIYQKAGIRSRAELSALVAADGVESPSAPVDN
ncbi:helix-turn-helix transcriptional regulator [Mycolicibacterium pulveris]|uniref:helix-turn-helix transcriptional regulator n=1 Tax=Mycolicibacterium pulveris TaxID=36813 RepID=UPI003CF461C6